MFASLIFAAPKSTTAKVADAAKTVVKRAVSSKPKALTPKQQQAAENKKYAAYASDVLAQVPAKVPRSAFNLFQKEAYFKTEDVGGFSELTKAYSKAWDALGETEKKEYEARAKDLQAAYNAELADFKRHLTPRKREVLDAHSIDLPRVKSSLTGKPSTNPWTIFLTQYLKDHPASADASGIERREHQQGLFKKASEAYKAQKQ